MVLVAVTGWLNGMGTAHTKKKYGNSSLPGIGKGFVIKVQRLGDFDSTNSSINSYSMKPGHCISPLQSSTSLSAEIGKHTVDSRRGSILIVSPNSKRKGTNKKPLNRHTRFEITILLRWAPQHQHTSGKQFYIYWSLMHCAQPKAR